MGILQRLMAKFAQKATIVHLVQSMLMSSLAQRVPLEQLLELGIKKLAVSHANQDTTASLRRRQVFRPSFLNDTMATAKVDGPNLILTCAPSLPTVVKAQLML